MKILYVASDQVVLAQAGRDEVGDDRAHVVDRTSEHLGHARCSAGALQREDALRNQQAGANSGQVQAVLDNAYQYPSSIQSILDNAY